MRYMNEEKKRIMMDALNLYIDCINPLDYDVEEDYRKDLMDAKELLREMEEE